MTPQALLFDTYGTVVDWRGSLLAELRAFGQRTGRAADWERFLEAWKAGYRPGMERVNRGEWPWTTIEEIYRRRAVEVAPAHGLSLDGAGIEELIGMWARLRPWPDAVAGLRRLKTRYVLSPLSNASFMGMVRLAKFAGLPWDCVITAENAKCYKPRAEVYLTALGLLGLPPSEVMLVAAHNYDLAAARSHGLRTAFVARPTEYGPAQTTDLTAEAEWDVIARDFEDLASRLGA
jgi:2-haloacid dehalogenase